ncbi:MAG TPA: hydrogen gas-evolving membrane-bound hydrogenase subunit E [Methanoregula sp.]|nr:hydrogen gas-evolving membrane-bound hydrogenase subunit E [Methanoregula sp.]
MKKMFVVVASLLIFAAFFGVMAMTLTFGSPMVTDMDDYFLRHGQEQTGSNNQCTAVVLDFRAFDTLGESTVLFCGIMGAALMFRKMQGGEEYEDE